MAAYLWLANSLLLFVVAFLFAVVSPAALVFAGLGFVALILAAGLLTRGPKVALHLASSFAGFLATLAGLAATSRPSLLPIAMGYTFIAISVAVTLVSATAASAARRTG